MTYSCVKSFLPCINEHTCTVTALAHAPPFLRKPRAHILRVITHTQASHVSSQRRADAYDLSIALARAGRRGRGGPSLKHSQKLLERGMEAEIGSGCEGAQQLPRRPRQLGHLLLPDKAAALRRGADTAQACTALVLTAAFVETIISLSSKMIIPPGGHHTLKVGNFCRLPAGAWAACRGLAGTPVRSHTVCARAAGAPQTDGRAAASGPASC